MTWLGAALVALLAVLALRWPAAPRILSSVQRLPSIAPALAALVAILITWSAWGSLDPLPTVGDEAAYLLQARLLASGQVVGEEAPIPAFFEQAHVLVTPRLAPKYPIGFGMALVPGIFLGASALVPLLLTGLSAALIFVLCRRTIGGAVAMLACAIWLAAPGGRYRSGFFSETLTTASMLAGWYALLRWRERRTTGWLMVVGGSMAVAAVTRPLTAIVLAIPVGIVVLRDAARLRSWRQVGAAATLAIPILGLLPWQDVASGGRWWQLPYTRYTDTYVPFDHIGFGLDTRAPLRAGPPEITRLAETFAPYHRSHTIPNLPAEVVARARVFFADLAGEWALLAMALVAVGLVAGNRALWFAAATGSGLMLVHLLYAHPPQWSIYYSESLPAAAAAAAAGVVVLLTRLARVTGLDQPESRTQLLVLLASVLVLLPLPTQVIQTRLSLDITREGLQHFDAALAGLEGPAMVFVRHAPSRLHRGLVRNPVNYAAAPVWTVHDLGAMNAQLVAMAPERSTWLYDEGSERLEPLPRQGTP